MSTRGSALQRTVNYFRECSVDEAHVTFQLVKQIVDARLKGYKAAKASQASAAATPRRKRRTKAEIAAAKAAGAGSAQGTLSVA